MPAVDQLMVLINLDRRQDFQVFGVPLNRDRDGLDSAVEIRAENYRVNGRFPEFPKMTP